MGTIIESSENANFRRWRKLLSGRGRRKQQGFLAESDKLIEEVLKSDLHVEAILAPLSQRQNEEQDNIIYLKDSLFRELSIMKSKNGKIAVVNGTLAKPFTGQIEGSALVLDHIQDPGNLGTILRSCEAFGIEHVIAIDCVDVENPKVLRASMGSAFRVNIYAVGFDEFKENCSFSLIGTDMAGTNYMDFAWKDELPVIGSEGKGIRQELREMLSDTVTIPMEGCVESLNAAISCSVILAARKAQKKG